MPQVMTEIETNCESFNFNIFKVRDLTGGNELVTVLLYLLTRQKVFTQIPGLLYDKMKRFITEIQHGYKNVTYHNKTHGADLC